MTKAQIQRIKRLRAAVEKARQQSFDAGRRLYEAAQECDHFDADGSSARKTKSTHDPDTCGGYKECAVCAGEQKETSVEVCQICGRSLSGSLTLQQAANREARNRG